MVNSIQTSPAHKRVVSRQGIFALASQSESDLMSVGTVLLIILIVALLGGFSGIGGGRFYGTGNFGGGGIGLVLVIVLVLVLLGKL